MFFVEIVKDTDDFAIIYSSEITSKVVPAFFGSYSKLFWTFGTVQPTSFFSSVSVDNPAVWAAIEQGAIGSIAVTLIYWSGQSQQYQIVPWTPIDSQAAANNFADLIAATTRGTNNLTAIGSAPTFATNNAGVDPLLNNFVGTRKVIDISGGGATNDGIASSIGGATALGKYDTINGLIIGGDATVLSHYQTQVIGGTGAFALAVDNFADFGDAIDDKIIKEVVGVPEPGILLLLGCALAGLYGIRRRMS